MRPIKTALQTAGIILVSILATACVSPQKTATEPTRQTYIHPSYNEEIADILGRLILAQMENVLLSELPPDAEEIRSRIITIVGDVGLYRTLFPQNPNAPELKEMLDKLLLRSGMTQVQIDKWNKKQDIIIRENQESINQRRADQ